MAAADKWLEDIGLGRYADLFARNHIDLEILPALTERDFEKLSISLGHRRRLMRAIGALRKRSGEGASTARLSQEPAAERRHLTVLFCDLVGSTALSARLDPEDMREVIRSYQECCAAVIARFDGRIAHFFGDGVLAFFGFPSAHEDDAERAVRVGLELSKAVQRLRTPSDEPLTVRTGIATGTVIVGDIIGEGAAQQEAVVGYPPNLASRLQNLAEPGATLISDETRRLLGDLFELVDLGEHQLKGFTTPARVWRVVGEGDAPSRFAALRGRGTALVGREDELGLLLSRWQRATEGDGQVVLLTGEPGIGKSCVAETLCQRLADGPCTTIRYFCSPFHVNSALHPVIKQLERAAGLMRDDDAEARLDKLEALMWQSTEDVAEAAALLATLLSIPTGGRYPPLELEPQRQRQRTLEILVDQLEGLAAKQPVLILFEDAQWIDPSTQELLDRAVERAATLPVLLVVTSRTELDATWTTRRYVTRLALTRLSQGHVETLVQQLAGGRVIPAEVLDQIQQRTDGVPLFVEELTKAVLESSLLKSAGSRYELSGELQPPAIPATLQDSLMARLDHLAPIKEVAQIGAVIGRDFSRELLSWVSNQSEEDLDAALEQIVQSELVVRQGDGKATTYLFKHGLIQETAYQSLLTSKRKYLHAQVARVIQDKLPEWVENQPEILAHHLTEAEFFEEAIDFWHKAGQRTIGRSENVEAIGHFTKGLGLVDTLEDTTERARVELVLQLALGRALIAAKGYAAPEVHRAYGRARSLSEQAGDAAQRHQALMGLEAYHVVRAELQTAHQLAKQGLDVASQTRDPVRILNSYHQLGLILFHLGEMTSARTRFEQAIELYGDQQNRPDLKGRLQDPGVGCRSYLALTLWHLGYPDQARTKHREALDLARAVSRPFSLAYALCFAGWFSLYCRRLTDARDFSASAVDLATEHDLPFWRALATCYDGAALILGDDCEPGIAELRRGMSMYNATGAELARPQWFALLAEGYLRLGRSADGLEAVAEGFQAMERNGERYFEPELRRLKGELSLRADATDRTGAEACFLTAIRAAQGQQARSLELRAATSLARLWRDHGQHDDARALLGSIYVGFTEGFDTADLRDAKTLLDALS